MSRTSEEPVSSLISFAVAVVVLLVALRFMPPPVSTVESDGHKWARSRNGNIVHHPDCPCRGKAEAEPP